MSTFDKMWHTSYISNVEPFGIRVCGSFPILANTLGRCADVQVFYVGIILSTGHNWFTYIHDTTQPARMLLQINPVWLMNLIFEQKSNKINKLKGKQAKSHAKMFHFKNAYCFGYCCDVYGTFQGFQAICVSETLMWWLTEY